MAIAPGLEAADDAAEVAIHFLAHEEDAVEVVGHHLQGDDLHLWVIVGNAPPFLFYALSEG